MAHVGERLPGGCHQLYKVDLVLGFNQQVVAPEDVSMESRLQSGDVILDPREVPRQSPEKV
eukprot:CAMPEP_0182942788 /NCGR_PEP_ID=MMETSP0105_2-20130417/51328_1 /TAXON_ID=81532 ORGANISM="Acanthoeca-like sp., Strain 10tr" /NCGR_SAMPLE_ID=MMETSP0105_2 /ASSEMBLY_ACC=CAM_ASM_000205 /LENGTH=60 /DNA_ID=CAMNT_0025082575 /DNA_START=131 /DNA_END=313 /DNA_ORIENTATION=+